MLPAMMDWRARLRDLLATGVYRTQSELVSALAEVGLDVNQGTVSRELQAMGVSKVDGFYRLAPPPELPAPVHRIQLTAASCLAVVHTDPAFASVLGQFIDAAAPEGMLGTVCGDDTVFVALTGREAAERLLRLLGVPRSRR